MGGYEGPLSVEREASTAVLRGAQGSCLGDRDNRAEAARSIATALGDSPYGVVSLI